ncbi:MAG: hypothetical protein J6J87_10035, partial [Oscillospiraceae bacterium]|nr:hypothetical protein [Oscillospiraceae bacterium]
PRCSQRKQRGSLAEAEGLGLGFALVVRWTLATGKHRPSARGFGVDVGKALCLKTFHSFQPFAGFYGFAFSESDAFLMLFHSNLLPKSSFSCSFRMGIAGFSTLVIYFN